MNNFNFLETPFCTISELVQNQLKCWMSRMPIFDTRDVFADPFSHRLDDYETPVGEISYVDPKTWFYSDVLFEEYADFLVGVSKWHLSVFDSPFRYEKPANVDIHAFTDKLIERTKIIAEPECIKNKSKIANKCRPVTIVSPAISVFNEHYLNCCRKFYAKTYHLYDVYSVDCCGGLSDVEFAFTTKLLNEVLKYDKKEVWVYFAVPCFDGNVTSYSFGNERYVPPSQIVAIQNVDKVINTFKAITDKVKFFYYGLGQDTYNPDKPPTPLDFWKGGFRNENYPPYWQWDHFIGFSDYEGKFKTDLMKKLFDTAAQLNASS